MLRRVSSGSHLPTAAGDRQRSVYTTSDIPQGSRRIVSTSADSAASGPEPPPMRTHAPDASHSARRRTPRAGGLPAAGTAESSALGIEDDGITRRILDEGPDLVRTLLRLAEHAPA